MLPIMVTFGKVKKVTFQKYLQFHIFIADKVRPKKIGYMLKKVRVGEVIFFLYFSYTMEQ